MLYFDHAATTPLCPPALAALNYWNEQFYNVSASYNAANANREILATTRDQVAAELNADSLEIYFTSGGTESDNWAFFTACHGLQHKGRHILVSAIEHPAVLETARFYASQGFKVDYIPVNGDGIVDLAALKDLLRDDTILVSVMAANNEVGTLQPLAAIGDLLASHQALFHTDAVQAFISEKLDVRALGIDLLSLSAHKFNGPKGIGALYINEAKRNLYNLPAMMKGGSQERERRAGTTPVPLIAGLGAALDFHLGRREEFKSKLLNLRAYLWSSLQSAFPTCTLNGSADKRLANNINVCLPDLLGEEALILLDLNGVQASHGSACASGSLDPSPVLLAMGKSEKEALSSLRFTLGYENTESEIDELIKILRSIG